MQTYDFLDADAGKALESDKGTVTNLALLAIAFRCRVSDPMEIGCVQGWPLRTSAPNLAGHECACGMPTC
jgi:hypothetical protein